MALIHILICLLLPVNKEKGKVSVDLLPSPAVLSSQLCARWRGGSLMDGTLV